MIPRLSPCRSPRAYLLARLPGVAWMFAGALLLGAALSGAPASKATEEDTRPTSPPANHGSSTSPLDGLRVREGTEIVDQPGHFQRTGDRVIFSTADGKRRFIGLENLNLERIARTVADSPPTLQWGVTGTITEYRGTNFLLIHRAILKSGMQSPGGSLSTRPGGRLILTPPPASL
jgi:hypothetical protein